MKCRYCGERCIKDGCQANGKQRYRCRHCRKRQQDAYRYKAYKSDTDKQIIELTKIGVGIRDSARYLRISPTTLLKRIRLIAQRIRRPAIPTRGTYEVDEMWSYIRTKRKPIWIAYALDRRSHHVVAFNVGGRSKEMLSPILTTLNNAQAQYIYTDPLQHYRSLIPAKVHKVKRGGTNHIERYNLNLRMHLKRLNRRTICFSRSVAMLTAILKIYFWG